MSFGLVLKEIAEEEKYIFGSRMLPSVVLQENANWHAFLPQYEPQFNKNFDTSGCSIFGTVNAVEILEKRIYGTSPNYSERYHYNLIPVRPPGGDPHAAAESVRKYGMIEQEALPMTDTFEGYIVPEPVPRETIKTGQKWLQTRDFGHEYLWRREPSKEQRIAILKEALKHSPVGVSVTAWNMDKDGLYVDLGNPNNHWCVAVSYIEDERGFSLVVFDSYDFELKTLHPDHSICMAKRYHLQERMYHPNWVIDLIKRFINVFT